MRSTWPGATSGRSLITTGPLSSVMIRKFSGSWAILFHLCGDVHVTGLESGPVLLPDPGELGFEPRPGGVDHPDFRAFRGGQIGEQAHAFHAVLRIGDRLARLDG